MTQPDDEDEPRNRRVAIQRKRLGTIQSIHSNGEYGFIDAEDFRDDVFFHQSVWRRGDEQDPPSKESHAPVAPLATSMIGMSVEFEIDDELFSNEKKLRAKVVRPTDRPQGRRMNAGDATFRIPRHHPNARRKRPSWRD